MIVDKVRFFVLCAKRKKNVTKIVAEAGLSSVVLKSINAGKPSTAVTVGKLATALQCQPEDLLKI